MGKHRPPLVDLFSGPGGCSVGYEQAGFDVTGFDNVWQINYHVMSKFRHADALTVDLTPYEVVHASPPCQRWSTLSSRNAHMYPDLITPMRQRLQAWGGIYVIENVPRAPLVNPVLVCGAALGLGTVCRDGVYRVLRRHRMFESNAPLRGTGCACGVHPIAGVYGSGAGMANTRGYKANVAERERLMDIDWMTTREMAQAIPPAYCRFLGLQIMDLL